MTTPDDQPRRESRFPDVQRQERDFPDTAPDTAPDPATTAGLVVTEERLADGRAITYFGTTR